MKIIICTRDLVAGAGQYTKGLLKEFDRNDEIKKILVIGPQKLKGYSEKIQFDILRLRGDFFITKELIFAMECQKRIKKALRKEKYDIIYTCHPFLISKKFNFPFIAIFHGLHKLYLHTPINTWKIKIAKIFHFLYSYFDYKTIQNADKIVFVSNRTLKEAEKFYPMYKNKFIHIPAFVDTLKFYQLNQTTKEKLIEKYKLEKDKKHVLYVGRLEPLKGIELLIEIIKESRESIKLELLVVGDGLLKKRRNFYTFVKYLGEIPHSRMNEIYNIVDLLILPSYYENCPLTILEAMASSCPVLASDVGDIGEILNNNKLIFEVGNIEELQRKMFKLLNLDENEKNEIISALVQKVNNNYNIEIISKKILDLYKNVAKK